MAIQDVSSKSLSELISLSGRTAVVTGAARGIGKAISRRLAEAGAAVVLGDLDEQLANESAAELRAEGYKAQGASLDAKRSEDHTNLAQLALDEFGSLDIWVNNAGVYPYLNAFDMTDDEWSNVIDLNLSGAYFGARAAAAKMRDSGKGGVIINLSSVAAYRCGGPLVSHYVASKHGIAGLTKGLSIDYASNGIRVLAVAPTYTTTEGIEAAQDKLREYTGAEDPAAAVAQFLPLGRVSHPDDVARVALFCASDLSMFMTGSTVMVDGGHAAT